MWYIEFAVSRNLPTKRYNDNNEHNNEYEIKFHTADDVFEESHTY